MPHPRKRVLFELGGQWIAAEPGRKGLYRYWTAPGTGRNRRASLGTEDLDEAKLRLAEIVLRGATPTDRTYLSVILNNYCEQHGDRTATGKQARHSARLFLKCWGETIRAGDVTEDRQRQFAEWSAAQGHAISYIARNFVVLAAALNRAHLPIDVVKSVGQIRERWGIAGKAPRSVFIPTDDDLALLWRAKMPENLRRWILIAMATGCRPTAALDLAPAARIREAGLIALNPEGRVQNKKRRPTVRCPAVLTKALDEWEAAGLRLYGGRYCGYASRYSVRQALERVCAQKTVNLPRLTLYSFRHKVTTVLRAAKVPVEQIAYQLGHRGPESRITAGYGEYDPDYLADACKALDTWIRRVQKAGKSTKRTKL